MRSRPSTTRRLAFTRIHRPRSRERSSKTFEVEPLPQGHCAHPRRGERDLSPLSAPSSASIERRRDIAALRLIGISRRSVVATIVMEAALISVVGSGVGVVVGWLASLVINWHYRGVYRTHLIFALVTPDIVGIAVGLQSFLDSAPASWPAPDWHACHRWRCQAGDRRPRAGVAAPPHGSHESGHSRWRSRRRSCSDLVMLATGMPGVVSPIPRDSRPRSPHRAQGNAANGHRGDDRSTRASSSPPCAPTADRDRYSSARRAAPSDRHESGDDDLWRGRPATQADYQLERGDPVADPDRIVVNPAFLTRAHGRVGDTLDVATGFDPQLRTYAGGGA